MGFQPSKPDKTAFTLAETLITLGIIGIVAAISIPVLINSYRRISYPMQLKAVYSKLLVAQKALNDEYGTPEDWTFTQYTRGGAAADENLNNEILKRYGQELGATTYCYRGNAKYRNCGIPSNARMLNGKPAMNIPGWAGYYLYEGGYCSKMQLKNGVTVAVYFQNAGPGAVMWHLIHKKYYAVFVVDINGISQPNMLGRDIFVFALKSGWDSIVPYSADTSDCNKNGAGLSCSRKIIADDWKMNY